MAVPNLVTQGSFGNTALPSSFRGEDGLHDKAFHEFKVGDRRTLRHWPAPGSWGDESAVIFSKENGRPCLGIRNSLNLSEPLDRGIIVFPNINDIFIDVDGVLANVDYYHPRIIQEFLRRHGIKEDLETVRQNSQKCEDPWHYGFSKVLKTPLGEIATKGSKHAEVIETFKEIMRGIEREDGFSWMRDFPLIMKGLLSLASKHFNLYIATNRDFDDTFSFLAKHSIVDHFNDVFCRSPYIPIKPNPHMLLWAQHSWDLSGKTVLMIGDQKSDMELANAVRISQRNLPESMKVEILPIGCLPPGEGYSPKYEENLFDSGAIAVSPNITRLIAQLLRAANLRDAKQKDFPNLDPSKPDAWKEKDLRRLMPDYFAAKDIIRQCRQRRAPKQNHMPLDTTSIVVRA